MKRTRNITKGSVNIDGIEIETIKKEIVDCNIIEVEVGTTGHRGGDTGHGGRTVFKIKDLASTDMRLSFSSIPLPKGTIKDMIKHEDGRAIERTVGTGIDAESIEITFGGDCELDTFIEALRFALETLESKVKHQQ